MDRKTKRLAILGVLTALAFILAYIEALLPFNMGIPGAKLGLANLVTMITLFAVGPAEALLLSLVRIVLTGLTFGNLSMLLYSLGGGLLSFLVMIAAKKTGLFFVVGVSVLGGVFHNIGQILVAMAVLETGRLLYYLPVLLLTGVVSGAAIGFLGALMLKYLEPVLRQIR